MGIEWDIHITHYNKKNIYTCIIYIYIIYNIIHIYTHIYTQSHTQNFEAFFLWFK